MNKILFIYFKELSYCAILRQNCIVVLLQIFFQQLIFTSLDVWGVLDFYAKFFLYMRYVIFNTNALINSKLSQFYVAHVFQIRSFRLTLTQSEFNYQHYHQMYDYPLKKKLSTPISLQPLTISWGNRLQSLWSVYFHVALDASSWNK